MHLTLEDVYGHGKLTPCQQTLPVPYLRLPKSEQLRSRLHCIGQSLLQVSNLSV
jgi:hypothetical protein